MRSTLEIIIAVKENEACTNEELRLALLAEASFLYFTESNLQDLLEALDKRRDGIVTDLRISEAKRWIEDKFKAQKKDPSEWLGPANIPGNPEYEARYKMMKGIYKAATGEDL